MSITGSPAKVIFDTSIYIPFLNKGTTNPLPDLADIKPILYMSSVVIEELYAGAFDAKTIKLIDKVYATFRNLNRLVVPDEADWQKTGKVVARLGAKYGFESKYLTRIQNDILISLTARRIGAVVITNNTRDFMRIKEFVDFRILENP